MWSYLSDHKPLALCGERVIIRDLDVDRFRLLFRPLEADTPLIINPDAVLALSVSAECFEPVPGRIPEVEKLGRSIKPVQCNGTPCPGNALKPAGMLAVGKPLGITVSIRRGHHPMPFPGAG